MKTIYLFVVALAATFVMHAQQTIYTVVLNKAPKGRNFPVMIGAANFAEGSNRGVMIGLANSVGQGQNGTMMSLLNHAGGDVRGAQFGLMNALGQRGQGALFGVINYTAQHYRGTQFGVMNVTKSFSGLQCGVVNLTSASQGFQLGVINYCDDTRGGVPFGVLSIVREGGYQAVEISSDFMFPVSMAFKSGVPEFYTSLIVAANPDFDRSFALGAGVGSIVELSRKVFFNPEFSYNASLGSGSASFFDLSPNFGYRFGGHFSLLAAPVFAMQHTDRDTALNKPLYHLYRNRIDARNELYVGLRLALRYNFDW